MTGLDEVLLRGPVVDLLQEHVLPDEVGDGLEGQVGVHAAGAVADEQREVVHVARLA